MSVAVGHTLPYGENLARTVIRRLVARDVAARVDVVIEPGASLESYSIRRNSLSSETPDVEVYLMEFVAGGRHLECPLAQFQARTQTVVASAVAPTPASEAAVTV